MLYILVILIILTKFIHNTISDMKAEDTLTKQEIETLKAHLENTDSSSTKQMLKNILENYIKVKEKEDGK